MFDAFALARRPAGILRHYPACHVSRKLRVIEIMNEVMRSATDEEVRALASFISRLPPPKGIIDVPNTTRINAPSPWSQPIVATFAIALTLLVTLTCRASPANAKII
jgi:hypothetical protein